MSFSLAEKLSIQENLEARNILGEEGLHPEVPDYLIWAAKNAEEIREADPENIYDEQDQSYSFSPGEKWTALILRNKADKSVQDSERRYVKGKNLEGKIPLNSKAFGQFMRQVEEETGEDLRFGGTSGTNWNIEKPYREGVLDDICDDFNPAEDLSYENSS